MKRFLLVIALTAISTVACAQEANRQNAFSDLDTDGDGFLSKKELQVSASIKLRLEDIDVDGDGKVSREELLSAFEKGSPTGPAGPTAR